MTVGGSICAAQLYDKLNNVVKIAKYKLSKYKIFENVPESRRYGTPGAWQKSAKNISID